MLKSIVIIIPFFGNLPSQYKMWRASALRNPTIDFMLFTDAKVEAAKNIIVHHMSFDEFRHVVQQSFDFNIVLDRPYKLCEYKQAYGYILQKYINGYDFWGFGDMDLVYGDIRAFLTDDLLTKFKFLLGWGHLTILHNDYETNTFFMKQASGFQNYQDAFSTKDITFFDEFGFNGCSDKWLALRPNDCWQGEVFDNVSKPKQSFHFNSLNRGWQQIIFEHVDNKLYMLRFNNKTLEKKESLYAHFQHRPFMKDQVKDYSHFLITPASMIDYPKHNVTFWLRFYCRQRRLATLYYQWKDRIIWKLNLRKCK